MATFKAGLVKGCKMKTKLGNINLFVRDLEQAKRFYMEAIGLEEMIERSAPPTFFMLDAGSCTLSLQDFRTPGADFEPGTSLELGFAVEDVEATEKNYSYGAWKWAQFSKWAGARRSMPRIQTAIGLPSTTCVRGDKLLLPLTKGARNVPRTATKPSLYRSVPRPPQHMTGLLRKSCILSLCKANMQRH